MIKFLVAILISTSIFVQAQVSFTSWPNGYMQVNSYNGNSSTDAYTATFSGNGNINMPHWKLSARLTQSIKSQNGQYTIPANKISFQPVSSTGQASPNPTPSFSQIGAPLNVFLAENAEVFLVPQSNAALYNMPSSPNAYYNLQLKFGISIMGGAYLGSYPAWTSFNAPIEFTAYDQYNNVIGKMNHTYQFQIGSLSGTPPVTQEMSLKVNTNAVNGLLEFDSMQDYSNGNSVTYPNGLEVSSNTNFQIKVRSLQSNLTSSSGNTIPVSVIHLNLEPLSQGTQTVYQISLGSTSQILVKGTTSQTSLYSYNIKYFTQAQDSQLINAQSGDYSTTLQYEITPQ